LKIEVDISKTKIGEIKSILNDTIILLTNLIVFENGDGL